ncbi:hypothetical protein BRCON_1386 [Candidatus Sumerlaea chitinivorans]|uniref:Uncharacterized protein n=1 Tax=Sumerlaea chitinivorans TaxID=2250252 RepID=A0A2Z4Y6N7_SUMC1|nr:hypothetical protein BRCON_1386 [Candidatus Sumerlaea chitinivorans]
MLIYLAPRFPERTYGCLGKTVLDAGDIFSSQQRSERAL